jgi:ribosomal-protein-alanine N-acetyltransferase
MAMAQAGKPQIKFFIDWMSRRNMSEVLYIESKSFDLSWTEEDFLRCLRHRNCIGIVAEFDRNILGFTIYELYKSKLHILNLAVHPDWRRQNVGSQMVQKLMGKLHSHRRTRITLAVRETNLTAQLFFKNQGFRAVRVLRNFYKDGGEDAYFMEYRLPGDMGCHEDEDFGIINQRYLDK